jgi:PKD domain
MGRYVRALALGVVGGCVLGGASAHAALTNGNIALPDYTKATPNHSAADATFRWVPPSFLPPTVNDRQELWYQELPSGSSIRTKVTSAANSQVLGLTDGRRYLVTVRGCQIAAEFCSATPINNLDVSDETRIDATAPSGTVQINGGAAFTNNPAATLTLAAIDPPIGTDPASASGVSHYAVDVDGDGTYPCSGIIIGGGGDNSGCARTFAATGPVTLTAGDGVKTVGVTFGDAAREVSAPCVPPFCFFIFNPGIQGNLSSAVTDTISVDTVKPVAVVIQDRTSVERTGTVSVNASTSTDEGVVSSGVDPALTKWDFKDGTPVVTGGAATHTYVQAGTFIGEATVTDRAGNTSVARQFVVTVTPRAGDTPSGSGSVAGISGSAAFALSRVQVTASYKASVLTGSLALTGTSSQAGLVRITLTPVARGTARALSTTLPAGAFQNSVKLPANLLPGAYKLILVGPGGTLSSTLTITAPREGIVSAKTLTASRSRAVVTFRFAALPATNLRKKLTVRWSQGKRVIATIPIGSATRLRNTLGGSGIRAGLLTAELRAGSITVAKVSKKVG